MYVPNPAAAIVDLDPIESRAIQRRRQLEEERKKRIFDPKLQKQAVDVNIIERQLEENRAKRQQQLDEEAAYARQEQRIHQALEQAQQLSRQEQLEQERSVANTNARLLAEHHHRAATDPWSPANQQPPRTEHSVPAACGVSSVQVLDGEDWTYGERQLKQKQQRQLWHLQAQREKQALDAAAVERRRQEAEHLLRVDRQVRAMQEQAREEAAARQREQLEVNRRLASERRQASQEAAARAAQPEQTTLVTQAWADLTLDRPHVWKFYTEEQRRRVLADEARDRQLAKERQQREVNEKSAALQHQMALKSATERLDEEEERLRQEQNRHVAATNREKSVGDRARIQRLDREFTTNTPTADFFSQFSTSSR